MKKRILTTLAVLTLLAGAAVVSAESGTVQINGGSLATTTTAVTLPGVTLDGTDQTTTDTTNSWTAEDPPGTGAGRDLTVAAPDFTTLTSQHGVNAPHQRTFPHTYTH